MKCLGERTKQNDREEMRDSVMETCLPSREGVMEMFLPSAPSHTVSGDDGCHWSTVAVLTVQYSTVHVAAAVAAGSGGDDDEWAGGKHSASQWLECSQARELSLDEHAEQMLKFI